MLQKHKSHAFGKDFYLLGQDNEGIRYWLQSAQWDCDGYWGFGYVETYTNNQDPAQAARSDTQQLFQELWLKDQDGLHPHKLRDWKGFESTLTEIEEGELSELMQQFYALNQVTALIKRAGYGLILIKEINETVLPNIFEKIYDVLNPSIQGRE